MIKMSDDFNQVIDAAMSRVALRQHTIDRELEKIGTGQHVDLALIIRNQRLMIRMLTAIVEEITTLVADCLDN